MSEKNREAAIKETLKWEGGYSNHPSDPGGPTNWGITIADARKYWKTDATAEDVKRMPIEVAIDIYRTKYWKTAYYDCDKLSSGVDLAVFDFGVNSGPSRAKRYLDMALGASTPEGIINQICDKRLVFLKSLKTWPVFGTGWSRRVAGIRVRALQMAAGKFNYEKGISGTIAAGGAVAASQSPEYWPFILIGTIGVAVAVYFIIRYIKKRKKNV